MPCCTTREQGDIWWHLKALSSKQRDTTFSALSSELSGLSWVMVGHENKRQLIPPCLGGKLASQHGPGGSALWPGFQNSSIHFIWIGRIWIKDPVVQCRSIIISLIPVSNPLPNPNEFLYHSHLHPHCAVSVSHGCWSDPRSTIAETMSGKISEQSKITVSSWPELTFNKLFQ